MTGTKITRASSKDKWYSELIKSLPLKNQTRPQTANHIADGMATILALAYITSGAPHNLSLLLIALVLFFIFGCIWVTKPKR